MARIRHKRTLVERTVPDAAVPFFQDYDVVKPEAPAEDKPSRGPKAQAETIEKE